MTKIKDLEIGMNNIDLEATVHVIEEPHTFSKMGRETTITNAILKDDTGHINLTLWNEQRNNIRSNSKVRIINGYVKEYKGTKQLNIGRGGSIEVLFHDDKKQSKL